MSYIRNMTNSGHTAHITHIIQTINTFNMINTLNTALFTPQGTDGKDNTSFKSTGFTRRFVPSGNQVISVSGTIPNQVIKIKFRACKCPRARV